MTEVVLSNAEQQIDSHGAAQQPVSAGMLLRQAREQQHMSVQALASALKVPVYKLQALEEDRWDLLTDSVFTRSLALSICRLLRIPSEPVLAGLPKHEAAKLASNPEGINAPFKEKTLRSLMSPASEPSSGSAVKLAAVALLAIAGGAGFYFCPSCSRQRAIVRKLWLKVRPVSPCSCPNCKLSHLHQRQNLRPQRRMPRLLCLRSL